LASISKQNIIDATLIKDAQRYRNQVVSNLISDGWNQWGVALLEHNRPLQESINQEQSKPEEFFNYEMQILNLDKNMQRSERCQRFSSLIQKEYKDEVSF